MRDFTDHEEMVSCPMCGLTQSKEDVYKNRSSCIYCNCGLRPTLEEEEEVNMEGYEQDYRDYWEKYEYSLLPTAEAEGRDFYEEHGTRDYITTFAIRALTSESPEAIKTAIKSFGGDLVVLETVSVNPVLTAVADSKEGQSILVSLGEKREDLIEWKIEANFFIESNPAKVALMAEIFNYFKISIIREEGTTFIISSNKGFAKGLVDEVPCDNNDAPILSMFITGWEKYLTLTNWVEGFMADHFKSMRFEDLMIMMDDKTLVPFTVIEDSKGEATSNFIDAIAGMDELLMSTTDFDQKVISFEKMLSEIHDDLEGKIDEITICSVRGIDKHLIQIVEDID